MRVLASIVLIAFLAACSGSKTGDENFQVALDSAAMADTAVDSEMINAVLQQIPSPLEISVMLRESGMQYNEDLMNPTSNVSNYNTTFQKALNLGIYGTDLGYTNIYSQNQDGIKYITTIKSLADDLNIGQFFDLETISNLATNSQNLDSLLLITTQNFNSINDYLQTQNRSNLSTLFLLGGWIEAMNITCQKAANAPENTELKQAIGDQKTVSELMKVLLDMFENETSMTEIREMMEPLWAEYEKVTITVNEGEQSSEVVDGVLVISDNSESVVDISQESLDTITALVAEIRNKVTM